MSAWKKLSPKRSFLNSFSLGCFAKYSSVNPTYETLRLALTPRGGSEVILIEFCRMETGKPGEGIEVSHSR